MSRRWLKFKDNDKFEKRKADVKESDKKREK
jgi:hypothetical protein